MKILNVAEVNDVVGGCDCKCACYNSSTRKTKTVDLGEASSLGTCGFKCREYSSDTDNLLCNADSCT